MKSKRDCLIEQNVERQLPGRFREMGMPNAGSSDLALAIRRSSDESPVTVVVADDHPVILEGLIKILNSQKDIRVVASAADGEEVRKLYYQFLPDVLILDLRLPKKNGLQVLNELMPIFYSERRSFLGRSSPGAAWRAIEVLVSQKCSAISLA